MTPFQCISDVVHLLSFFVLLLKLWIYNSAQGLSGKTQILMCLVFTTRYLDLFTNPSNNFYLVGFKLMYLSFAYSITILIYTKFRRTYQKQLDTFWVETLIFAALIAAYLVNYRFTFMEVAWTFSEYLEAVAAWPQFYMVAKAQRVTKMVFLYLTLLGVYRLFMIMSWAFKYYNYGYLDLISVGSGSVQVVPYIIFWILCIVKVVEITTDKTSWFGMNLTGFDQAGVFTIEVTEKNLKNEPQKLPLLNDSEPIYESSVNLEEHPEKKLTNAAEPT